MRGLMMDYQLNLGSILRRAEQLFGPKEIVSRGADRSFHRYTYADFVRRAKQLTLALQQLGIESGDRVATLCWNNHQHLEAYFGVPLAGAVVHTVNPRLHPNDLTHIINDAQDKFLLVEKTLWPVFAKLRDQVQIPHIVVIGDDDDVAQGTIPYERLLDSASADDFSYRDVDENQAAAMCYTSGTTGQPKGVLYSHRSLVLHSMALAMTSGLDLRETDVILPVVPMFHVNAWGLPFAATMVGAKQVFPGPYLDPVSLLETFQNERVTFSAGVPTVWLGVLQALDQNPGAYDLSSLRMIPVGGSAAPASMIQGFEERHGLNVLHAWGMTELTPLGTTGYLSPDLASAPKDVQLRYRAKQGRPVPFVEIRSRGENGLVLWDGQSMGELEVRGPWVAGAYFNAPDSTDRFTEDGWFKTGDIVTIDPQGYVEILDRSKDLIKSGGEWISSVALENALMGHPAIAEAAVIAVPDARWQERPLAVIVLREGHTVSGDELLSFLQPQFAKWWLPDRFEVIDKIPRTGVGKFLKSALREQFGGAQR